MLKELEFLFCRGNASPNMKVVVQLVRRYISGHKGPVSCLLTFLASSGEVLLAFPHCFLQCCSEGFLLLEYIGEVLMERAALRINSEKNLGSRSLFCNKELSFSIILISHYWYCVFVKTLLVSGGNDGTLSLWNVDGAQAQREVTPKLSVKVVRFCSHFLLLPALSF